ncbi:hypothetical protein IPD43_24135 [Paenibacillus polymyxa]|uniref:Uncharacterized protein n=1 Tax=Paenibacillus polymyxa TaxID=1406 RepID=A0A378XXH8_PAEPO|nr:hypothetical protein [Paenibacillus polymyxa]SUA69732.1 Uncharacterised protein [Paenibacillus polymyxa]
MEWLEKDKLFTIATNKKSCDFRSNNVLMIVSLIYYQLFLMVRNLWTKILASSMVCFTVEAAGWSLANRRPWPAQSDIYSGLFAFAAA